MQSGSHQQDGRRVRNVPIRLERDMAGSPQGSNSDHHQHNQRGRVNGDHQAYNPNYHYQTEDSEPNQQQHQFHTHRNLNEPNRFNRRTSPHTSSININYKPEHEQTPPRKGHQQQQTCNNRYETADERSQPVFTQSSRAQSRQSDKQYEPNKENSESSAFEASANTRAKNENKSSNDHPEEQKPISPPPPVIPLPPPPSQDKPKSDQNSNVDSQQEQQQKPQPQQQATQDQSEDKMAKQETGPLAVISSTKNEVNRLLQEVANCNETSTKSKEFLRLEELLTLCILKLDDIQGPEWRQQRKEVINMINKCTDILERKIDLNNDIKQLAANCQ